MSVKVKYFWCECGTRELALGATVNVYNLYSEKT